MKLICIFLAGTLVVAAAKPYGIKGGYDRDSDRLVQSHIPVNEDFNEDRLELNQGRKIGRPVRPNPGVGAERPIGPIQSIGGGYGEIDRRPVSGVYGEIDRRPIGGGYSHDYHGRIVEVGNPIGGGLSHNSHLETQQVSGQGHRPQQGGGIKRGQQIGY